MAPFFIKYPCFITVFGCFSDVALILFMQLFATPPYQFIAAKKHITLVPTIAKYVAKCVAKLTVIPVNTEYCN